MKKTSKKNVKPIKKEAIIKFKGTFEDLLHAAAGKFKKPLRKIK